VQVEIGGEEAYIVAGGLDSGNRFLSSVESWSTRQGSSYKVSDLVIMQVETWDCRRIIVYT
jgi:hypothetical protein